MSLNNKQIHSTKKLFSLLAAAAVMLSLSAYQSWKTGQDLQTSQTVESAVTVSETVQAAETTAPDNSEETPFVTEYEITDWTMEELLSDVEINCIHCFGEE